MNLHVNPAHLHKDIPAAAAPFDFILASFMARRDDDGPQGALTTDPGISADKVLLEITKRMHQTIFVPVQIAGELVEFSRRARAVGIQGAPKLVQLGVLEG